jgi:hypothetical protein
VCVGERGREPVGKTPPERPRGRWENIIKMGLNEIGREGMDWISLAIGSMAVNLRVP